MIVVRARVSRSKLSSRPAPMHHLFDLLAASTHSSRRIDSRFKLLRSDGGMNEFTLRLESKMCQKGQQAHARHHCSERCQGVVKEQGCERGIVNLTLLLALPSV